jgi:hypothetical protein
MKLRVAVCLLLASICVIAYYRYWSPLSGGAVRYSIMVDYDRSIEKYMGSLKRGFAPGGDYDPDFTSENFPTQRTGRAPVVIELLRIRPLHRLMKTDEVEAAIKEMGFRPIELRELLALHESYPEVVRQTDVVALGSRCCDGLTVPLYGVRDDRDRLDGAAVADLWGNHCVLGLPWIYVHSGHWHFVPWPSFPKNLGNANYCDYNRFAVVRM